MKEEAIDLRGEVCSMPELRVEKILKSGSREPITLLLDHRPTLESIQALASRHGWRSEVAQDERGDFRVVLFPS